VFVDGSSAISTTSKTANISAADSGQAEGDDSFFSAWLASQSQEAGRSPSAVKSPLAPKHQPSRHTESASLKATKLLPRTSQSETTDRRDDASGSEKQLRHATSLEQSAVKSDEKEVTYSQLQPISVNISDDRQARSENTNMAGLLISTNTDEIAKTSLSEVKFDENVTLDKGSLLDVRKSDRPETSVTLFVSEDGTDGSRDEYRLMSAEPDPQELDTSASSRHFNSQLSSSILSPEPDELFGIDSDLQPEAGWSDTADMWLSSTIDLPDAETEDISAVECSTTKPVDQTSNGDVDLQAGVVDSVDEDDQICDNEETSINISTDTSSILSTEADVRAVKEIPSLEGSMKEISSLEGSLEASADELSEGNKQDQLSILTYLSATFGKTKIVILQKYVLLTFMVM